MTGVDEARIWLRGGEGLSGCTGVGSEFVCCVLTALTIVTSSGDVSDGVRSE